MRLIAGRCVSRKGKMRMNELYDAVKRVWKPVDEAGAVVQGR